MMIRSAPPASANLADIPVPAPTPRRAAPWLTVARSLAMHCSRESMCVSGSAFEQTHELCHQSFCKLGVVYMDIQLSDLDRCMLSDGIEPGGGSGGIVERLARSINSRDAPKLQYDFDPPARAIRLLCDQFAHTPFFLHGRPHQRDARVVL